MHVDVVAATVEDIDADRDTPFFRELHASVAYRPGSRQIDARCIQRRLGRRSGNDELGRHALRVSAGAEYRDGKRSRQTNLCERFPKSDCLNSKSPSEYLRTQIFADSMVFSEEGLRHLVAEMGASQVVYGTDVPFPWPETMHLIIDSPTLSDADKEAILGGNLMRLLRIEA